MIAWSRLRFWELHSIRAEVLLLVAVPMALFLFLAGQGLFQEYKTVKEAQRLEVLTDILPPIQEFVHAFQVERARSVLFLTTHGSEEATKTLKEQRAKVNLALGKLEPIMQAFPATRYGDDFAKQAQDIATFTKQINAFRARVDAQSLQPADAFAFITGRIHVCLDLMNHMTEASTDEAFTRMILANVSLSDMKELMGQERAIGGRGFQNGSFSLAEYQKFVGLIAQQKARMETFEVFATPTQAKALAAETQTETFKNVKNLETIALSSLETQTMQGVQAQDWIKATTDKINVVRTHEKAVTNDLMTTMAAKRAKSQWHLTLWSFFSALIVGATVWASLLNTGKIVGPITNLSKEFALLAQYDLTRSATVERDDELGAMAGFFNSVVKNFHGLVGTVRQSAQMVGVVAEDMTNSMHEITTKTATQRTSFTQIAEAIGDSSKASSEISRLIANTQTSTENIQTVTLAAGDTMQGLQQASGDIVQVTDIIRGISEQINLLALNASIEAARAGDAGRGFAVVADEVRKLANNTRASTQQIADAITKLQHNVESSGEALHQITGGVHEITANVSNISSAVSQQSAALEEISATMHELSAQVESANMSVEQASVAADMVMTEVNQLNTRVAAFKV